MEGERWKEGDGEKGRGPIKRVYVRQGLMLSVSGYQHEVCVHVCCLVCFCMFLFWDVRRGEAIEEIGHEGDRQARFAFAWLTDFSVSW